MKRTQLAHVLRAAAEISGEKSFVLVGSQAVLLLLEQPEGRLTLSEEIDLYPAVAPDKADLIDGALGALSPFHDEFGYHADGVSPDTAVMPADWMDRAVFHYFGDITAICPDLHDLAVSKCVAGREKDAEFLRALFEQGHLEVNVLIERIRQLDGTQYPVGSIEAWARRRHADALHGKGS